MEVSLQAKYSGLLPTFVDCQKESETTVGNGTQVKSPLKLKKSYGPQNFLII